MIGPLAAALAAALAAGPPEPTAGAPAALEGTRVEHLRSKANGVAYRLLVSTPPGEAPAGAARPLVVLLDADYAFPIAHAVAVHLRERRDLPDLVLVAVGYDGPPDYRRHRTRDYTPTRVPDGGYGPELQRESGGGPAFLDFLEHELVPWAQARLHAAPRPVLVGHSYGGLFALWAALERPGLLSAVVAVSPSLWYDDGLVARLERALPGPRRQAALRIYAAVGALEGGPDRQMVGDLRALGETLRPPRWPAVEARIEVLDGETHNSVFPRALSNGLRFLWPRGSFEPSRAPGTRP